jgi:hypothetical protein
MIQVTKDFRSRWRPVMGRARIFWGMLTNDKWLQLEGSHQRRTSLLITSTAFAQRLCKLQAGHAGMPRSKGV